MSSKKQLRQKRKQQRAVERKKKGINPATAFIVITVAVFVLVGLAAAIMNRDSPPPPYPGAVWSEEHGHWH